MPATQSLKALRRETRANQVRATGHIPGIVYGHKLDSQNVAVNMRDFLKVYDKAGSTTLVNLELDGTTHNVLIRDVQFHPVRDQVLHIDFYQVRMDEAIEADVPLKFVGESAAVKDMGGVFVRNMDAIAVTALPKDLPYEIEVDISSLTGLDSVIHIADLKLPEGVTITYKPTDVIALIQPPRSEAELASLTEEIKEDLESIEATAERKEEPEGEGEAAGEAAGAADAPASDDK